MILSNEQVYRKVLKVFGDDRQVDMMIEEMSELIVALQHYRRGRVKKEDVLEEIADVQIMLNQMKLVYGKEGYLSQYCFKMDRLSKLLGGD